MYVCMLHCGTDVERVKNSYFMSIFQRISIIIFWFLLLYFVLHSSCVICHIVLTLIECNLQLLCWFLDLFIVLYCVLKRKKNMLSKLDLWQVEEASAELGLAEGAVRYWFSDWDGSLRLSDPNTYTSPPFLHPRIWTVPVS